MSSRFGAEDDGRTSGETVQRVLVQDAGHGLVKIGQLVAELDGTFKENLDGYRPKLVVIGGSIVAKKVPDPMFALHGGEDGPRNLGEIREFLLKVLVLLGLGDKIDISEGMGHLMKPDIAVGRLPGDTPHKIIPGEIDAGLIHMSHEGPGVESIVIIIPQDEDIVEVIELELIQPKGQLHGRGADKDRHFGRLFHLYIMEVLGVLEEPGTEEEPPLVFEAQPVIIPEMMRNDGMIKGLFCEKSFELMSCIKTLTKRCDRTIKKENPQHQ